MMSWIASSDEEISNVDEQIFRYNVLFFYNFSREYGKML